MNSRESLLVLVLVVAIGAAVYFAGQSAPSYPSLAAPPMEIPNLPSLDSVTLYPETRGGLPPTLYKRQPVLTLAPSRGMFAVAPSGPFSFTR